jgi:hypothetical protein
MGPPIPQFRFVRINSSVRGALLRQKSCQGFSLRGAGAAWGSYRRSLSGEEWAAYVAPVCVFKSLNYVLNTHKHWKRYLFVVPRLMPARIHYHAKFGTCNCVRRVARRIRKNTLNRQTFEIPVTEISERIYKCHHDRLTTVHVAPGGGGGGGGAQKKKKGF